MTQQDDCRQCLIGIAQMDQKLTTLNNSIMRIVYALLAVVGANIGTKFIGTPWYIEIAMYSTMFGGIFVFLITVAKYRCLSFWERWIRFTFVGYTIYVTILRIYHYQTNTALTQIEGMVANAFLCTLAVGFILLAWQRDSKRIFERRRYNDQA